MKLRELLKDPVHTAQWTLFISVMKTNQFMLHETEVALCSEINTKHVNTVWQIVKFLNAKPVGASRY